jgi:hypothetical protein
MLKRIIHYLLSLNGFPLRKGAVSVTEIEEANRDEIIDIPKLGRLAKFKYSGILASGFAAVEKR